MTQHKPPRPDVAADSEVFVTRHKGYDIYLDEWLLAAFLYPVREPADYTVVALNYRDGVERREVHFKRDRAPEQTIEVAKFYLQLLS